MSWAFLCTNLKDGIHDAGQRPVVRVLCNIEDVQTPLVDVLQVLQKEDPSNYGTNLTKIARFTCNRWSVTYLREQVLQICLYAKTGRTAAAGQTRAKRDLPHPADLSHKLLLLLPPLPLPWFRSGRWDLQFILFIYRGRGFGLLLMRLLISALAHSIHYNSHDFSDSLSKFKSPKKVWYYYKPPTKTFLPSSTVDATAKCSLLKITT